MIYLDSSAAVKLVHPEADSQALRDWLDERADIGWVSSVLLEIEACRALARHAPSSLPLLPAVLDLIELVDLASEIRLLAQAVTPVTVRSLDAVHLATALHLRDQVTTFVAYDLRLAEAARAAGLPVEIPADGTNAPPDADDTEVDKLLSAQISGHGSMISGNVSFVMAWRGAAAFGASQLVSATSRSCCRSSRRIRQRLSGLALWLASNRRVSTSRTSLRLRRSRPADACGPPAPG